MLKLAIFLIEKYPYHAAIIINNKKISDLSLLGSRIVELSNFDFKNYISFFYDLNCNNTNDVIDHLSKPIVISRKIINKERGERGWFKSKISADYILEFRNKRSKNIDDMNCIEWIALALEIGGYNLPDDILTASKLFDWSNKNLIKTKIDLQNV